MFVVVAVVVVVIVRVAVVLDVAAVLVISNVPIFVVSSMMDFNYQQLPLLRFPNSLVVVPFHHTRCFHPHLLQSPSMQVSSNIAHRYATFLCSWDVEI